MKKIYLSLLLILISITYSDAQSLTQANHAPVVGDSYSTRECSTVNVTPGSSGATSVWTFTDLSTTTVTTNYFGVTVASTGSATSYPSADVAVQSSTSKSSFYSSSSSLLNYWGGNIVIGGFPLVLTFSTPAIQAKYPMSFGTTTTSAVGGSLSALSNNGTFSGTCSTTADATGTLVLPARTFTDVIRIENSYTLSFSVPSIFATGGVVRTVYEYYSPISKAPILTISQAAFSATVFGNPQSDSQTLVDVLNNYDVVGLKENNKEVTDLKVFPNPASGNVNISLVNDLAEPVMIELINVLGQTVKKQEAVKQKGFLKYSFELSEIETGIYFMKVVVGNKVSVQRITVQ